MDQSCLQQNEKNKEAGNIELELYFLIAKFLSNGPCKKAYEALKEEIENSNILPPRLDWLGGIHKRNFEEYENQNVHISKDFLLSLVKKLGPTVQQVYPTYPTTEATLLGTGTQSLLRTKKDLQKVYSTAWSTVKRLHGNPILEPKNLKCPPHSSYLLFSREISSSVNKTHFLSNKFYSRLELFARNVGHLSAVYCMLFDRHGRYIITGADDMLVKIWSIIDGRLVATLRGASAEITDLALDHENTMVAAGSCDKIIRVWSLQTLTPIAVLTSHTGMITSLLFCPSPSKDGVLVSTGGDGCVSFWTYRRRGNEISFDPKPLKMNERVRPGHAQLICASFSQGGSFLVIGGADHFVRVYFLNGPEGVEKILEIETHQDRVDSIQWCHNGIGFASGSRNGTALLWRFERQQWKSIKLDMTLLLPGFTVPAEVTRKLQVTMVGWDRKDAHVVTASSDRLLRVWDSCSGQLKHILKGHEDNAYVIEAHPKDNRLILSAGHDGQLFIWDIFNGTIVKSFKNTIEGQGYGSLFDAKWTPDGFNIAATDSHGHILIFGIGHNDLFKKIPQELFFHTDYRPLVRDVNHHVLDEQTQLAPHLMPPPFLVNIDGDPYPPNFQRLVPGRENCREDQLIPNVVTNDDGEQEVLDIFGMEAFQFEAPSHPPQTPMHSTNEATNSSLQRPSIDDMIERLAHEQGQRMSAISLNSHEGVPGPSGLTNNEVDTRSVGAERRGSLNGPHPDHSYAAHNNQDPLSPRAGRVGSRRVGDVEGVRQSTGNWQRDPNIKWKRRMFLKPLSQSALKQSEELRSHHGDLEVRQYETECCKKPESVPRPQISETSEKKLPVMRNKKQKRHAYSTRASRGSPGRRAPSPEIVQPGCATNRYDSSHSDDVSADSEPERENFNESSSDDQSTDYSDWTADAGINLEPPKRTAHKQKKSPVDVKNKRKSRSSEDKSDEFSDSHRKHRRRRRGVAQVDSDEDETEFVSLPSTSRQRRGIKRVNMSELNENGSDEIPIEYRIPDWLSETIPKKAPYFPQMGDEIMYYRQGHQLYVEAVINRKLYAIDKRSLPWFRKHNLRDQEHVKIIGIKYEIKPPRLCCLKLGIINNSEASLGSDSFTIKYHDMEDVLDFLVLKQTYDNAVRREWKPGDRFRCIIDDAWWFGVIESKDPHLPEFPDSMFMCYRVLWDNGERERLSPWDLDSIDPQTQLPELGGCVKVHPREHQDLLYTINPEEWAGRNYGEECVRIGEGLSRIMELSPAEPFLTPVDLNGYPEYAMIVDYPIDLSTIKSRVENYFYRRPTAIQFDVRYIATNAEKFNEKGSSIVKQARIITDLCLKLIKDRNCCDPTPLYHEIQSNYHSPNHSEDELGNQTRSRRRNRISDDDDDDDQPDAGRSKVRGFLDKPSTSSASRPRVDSRSWQVQCKDLLRMIFERQDSAPFRYPVNLDQYQDYNQVIDVPMDLTTVREELNAGGYASPHDFAKDMRLVFSNSKTYNTNKRSRIYSMTLRLEAYFEDQFKGIVATFKAQEENLEVAHSSRHDVTSVNLHLNGLLSSNEESSDEDQSPSMKGSTNEGGKRRSRRVARLRQRQAEIDDSEEEYSPFSRLPKKNSIKGSPIKLTRSNKQCQLKKQQPKRYEYDSDYEVPPPPRRNSSSSSTKTKRSKRYEDDSDFEGPPVSPVRMQRLSDQELSAATSTQEEDELDDKDKIEVKTEECPQENLDNKDSCNLKDEPLNSKTNGSLIIEDNKENSSSSSSESESDIYKPRLNGYNSKSSKSSNLGDTSSASSSSNTKNSFKASKKSSKKEEIKSKGKFKRKRQLTSNSDSDSSVKPQKKQMRQNVSSPERGISKPSKDDSDYELDDEELEESDESEIEKKNARKSRRTQVASVVRKSKKAVLDGDDLEDSDFELGDFIDDAEASLSESSESDESEDSSEPSKKNTKKSSKAVKPAKRKLPPKKRPQKKHKKLKPKPKRLNKGATNKRKSTAKKSAKNDVYQSFKVSPETHNIKHVRHKGQVIGRVITQKEEDDLQSEDYSETPLNSEDEESAPLGVHSMVIGNFSEFSSTAKQTINDSFDEESDDEDLSSEVGRRGGRVRKRVQYAEEDSDGEMASVSSRGRVRRANTRMRDFV